MKTTLGIAALLASAMMLSGCAIPIGVQIAKLSLDGISYLTTQKSLTDHGLSLLTGEDCAMHRIITRGALCSEWKDEETVTVDLKVAPNGEEAALPEPGGEPAQVPVGEFETAAGQPVPATPASAAKAPERPKPATVESRLDRAHPTSIEARAEPEKTPRVSTVGGDRIVVMPESEPEDGPIAAANIIQADEVAFLAGEAAPPATAVGLPESPALLSLWETGIEVRDEIVSARERWKILEAAEMPSSPDKPARPEPIKAVDVGVGPVARVSGLLRAGVGGA